MRPNPWPEHAVGHRRSMDPSKVVPRCELDCQSLIGQQIDAIPFYSRRGAKCTSLGAFRDQQVFRFFQFSLLGLSASRAPLEGPQIFGDSARAGGGIVCILRASY